MKALFLTRSIVVLTAGALVFGCAQDRSSGDFKKQQAQDELAKGKPAEGAYTGVLYDSKGAPLGALQMVLKSEMGAQTNTDGTGGTAAPTLTGYIDYLNEGTPVSFVTSTSNYDYTTGKYNADVIINTSATTTSPPTSGGSGTITTTANQQIISFSGIIHDGKITDGIIRAKNSSTNILNFSLSRTAGSLVDVAAKVHDKSSSADPVANQLSSFLGVTTFKSTGETKPVHILILKPRKGSAEDFLNLVVPNKSVTVSLNYGGALQLVHSNSTLDMSKGSLTGTAGLSLGNTAGGVPMTTTNVITFFLDCHFSNQNKRIKCTQSGTSGTGILAETIADLDLNNSQDPPDTSAGRVGIRKLYKGFRSADIIDSKTGKVTGQKRIYEKQNNGKLTSEVDLLISYPAKSRTQELVDLFFAPTEQNVLVTVVAYADTEDPQPIPIQNVVWDHSSGNLNGNDKISFPSGGQANLTIDCSNFKSTPTSTSNEPFVCDYTSNQGGVYIHFTGSSK